VQVITAISLTAYFYCTAIYYFIYPINLYSRQIPLLLHFIIAPFILIMFLPFIFNVFHDGLVIALLILNNLTREDIMKRFMEMFEDIMVAVTFAEAGVSVSFLQQKDNHEELGEPAWDLKA
jgi:hypothetical protein